LDGASIYILQCVDGSYYTGITRRSVEERVSEHAQGLTRDCYTFMRRPVKLILAEHYERIVDAIAAERRIKGWSRAKTYGPPRLQDDLARLTGVSLLQRIRPRRSSSRPRWRYARFGPHKRLGVERRFLNQVSEAPFDCQIPWGLGLRPKLGQSAVTTQSPVGADHAEQSGQHRNRNSYPHRSSRDFRFLGIESNDVAGHLAVPGHAGEDVKVLCASR
jgi:putative endonuclease